MSDEKEIERRVELAKTMGAMQADIENIKSDVPEIKATTGKIFATLEGKNGLVSKVAVLETQQKDAPTLKKMMVVGAIWGGSTSTLIVLGFFAIKAFSG